MLGGTDMSCQIVERQSTFWDIANSDGTVRIHFQQKEEFHFASAAIYEYGFTEDHPLLLEYRAHWEDLYISSSAARPAEIVSAILAKWNPILSGWRSPFGYFSSTDPERMLSEGFGQLISSPEPLSKLAAAVLAEAGLKFNILQGQSARWPRKALVAGDNYVVAAGFRVEPVVVGGSQ